MSLQPPKSTADAEEILRSAAQGPPAAGEEDPWDFVLKWPEATLERVVWPVVSRLLVDSDDQVRSRAINFVDWWRGGEQLTVDRLIEIASHRATTFRNSAERDRFVGALANKATSCRQKGPKLAQSIVAALEGRPPPTSVVPLLAKFAPEALVAAAPAFGSGASAQMAAQVAASSVAMYGRDHLIALLRGFSKRSTAERESIVNEATMRLKLTDADLLRILEVDKLSMPQTRPSVADCRQALGLS
jgi:hypothetical protein